MTRDEGDGGPGGKEEEVGGGVGWGCLLGEVVLTEGGVEGVSTHD